MTTPDSAGREEPVEGSDAPGEQTPVPPTPADDVETTAVRRQSLMGRGVSVASPTPADAGPPAGSPSGSPAAPASSETAPTRPVPSGAAGGPAFPVTSSGSGARADATNADSTTRAVPHGTGTDTTAPDSSHSAGQAGAAPGAGWTPPRPGDHSENGDPVLEGATQARPRSRAAAHWWSLLISLVLTPVAWYLVADGGARLTLGENSQWATGRVDAAALAELVGGLVVVAALLLTARWSALGAFVVGPVVLLGGLGFLVAPAQADTVLAPALERLRDWNAFGGNVAHHLLSDGPSGRLALYGLALLLLAIVAAGARRAGRADQRRRDAYERGAGPVAPESRRARHRGRK